VESILQKALQKDRNRRYQTAAEMRADIESLRQGRAPKHSVLTLIAAKKPGTRLAAGLLGVAVISAGLIAIPQLRQGIRRRIGGETIEREKQLAVLPFEVPGGDPSTRAFGEGLTETLTAKLTQLTVSHALQVVSASEIHARQITAAGQARQELGVNLALEGNLSRSGDRIRINYSLVDTRTHRQLKADSITATVSDPFALQDQVVNGALRMLGVVAQPPELVSLETHGTQVPDAYDFYLQGRGYLRDYDKPENLDDAVSVFRRAIALDPNFALAYAALGQTYWQKYVFSKDPRWIESARQACERALNPDPQLAAAHVCLGQLERGTGEYEKAVKDFGRAVQADPTSDTRIWAQSTIIKGAMAGRSKR
jgi:TolB-like protein